MALPLASFAVSAAVGLVKSLAGADDKHAKAKKTADDFETMFLEQTFDRMVTSLGEDGPMGENGTGGPVYRSMLMKEYAGSIVKNGGVGISDQIYREILKLQEGSHGA